MADAKKKQVKMRKNGKRAKRRAQTIEGTSENPSDRILRDTLDFLKNVLYIYGRILLTNPKGPES